MRAETSRRGRNASRRGRLGRLDVTGVRPFSVSSRRGRHASRRGRLGRLDVSVASRPGRHASRGGRLGGLDVSAACFLLDSFLDPHKALFLSLQSFP